MRTKSKVVALFAFLTSIVPVFAQVDGIGQTIANLGKDLTKIFNTPESVFIITIVFSFMLFYAVFAAILSSLKWLEGEDGNGINKQGNIIAISLSGLVCLGLFALKNNLIQFLNTTLGTFGLYGGMIMGAIVYVISWQMIKKSEINLFGIKKAELAAIAPASIGLWVAGSFAASSQITSLALITGTFFIIALIINLIHQVRKIKSNRTTKNDEKNQEALLQEETKEIQAAERTKKGNIYQQQLSKQLEDYHRGDETYMHDEELTITEVDNTVKAIANSGNYPTNKQNYEKHAEELMKRLNWDEDKRKQFQNVVSDIIKKEIEETHKQRRLHEVRCKELSKKSKKIKDELDKSNTAYLHAELKALKTEHDELKDKIQDKKNVEKLEAQQQKVEDMITKNGKKMESLIDKFNKGLKEIQNPNLDEKKEQKIGLELQSLFEEFQRLEIITKQDLHELGEDVSKLIEEFRKAEGDEAKEEKILDDYKHSIQFVINAENAGPVDQNKMREFQKGFLRNVAEEATEEKSERHEHK